MTRTKFRSLPALVLASSVGLGLSSVASAQDAEEKHWYDDLTVGAFVDTYGAIRSDRNHGPRTPDPTSGQGSPVGYPHEAYVQADGFGLAFAGADVNYSGEKFGATLSLRFGPGVNRFYGGDNSLFGMDNIVQAFATWKPFDKLTLDMGQFYTIYGGEVTESWRNLNYSRGALYYAMQPFWHTGLRANYALNDMLSFNAMVVNGVNTAFENNKSPSLGGQVLFTPTQELFFALGYLGALNPRAGGEETGITGAFDHFIDFVATVSVADFKLVVNADYNIYRPRGVGDNEFFYGISVAPGYAFTNWFGAAIRGEFLQDSAGLFGAPDAKLATVTGTLDFKPIPNSSAVVLRPEFRYEIASEKGYYANKDNEPDDKFWSAHLGVVVTSMD